ncbi:hypothetical protein ABTG41_18590, partial [Acinetobacter baumannii]
RNPYMINAVRAGPTSYPSMNSGNMYHRIEEKNIEIAGDQSSLEIKADPNIDHSPTHYYKILNRQNIMQAAWIVNKESVAPEEEAPHLIYNLLRVESLISVPLNSQLMGCTCREC